MLSTRIRKHERGLHFRHGDFMRVLGPGKYRLWTRLWSRKRDDIQVMSLLHTKFEHGLLDVIVADEAVRDELLVVDLNDNERAIVWKDDRLGWVLGPGRHAFWRKPAELAVETYNVEDFRFLHPRLEAICAHKDASKWLTGIEVSAHEDVLLFRDGKFIAVLNEGSHVFWKGAGKVTWKAIDKREQIAEVAGQEIMTADKVTLRVNLTVVYQVADALKAATVTADHALALYREAQLALRAVIGTRTLDALLADKEAVGGELRGSLAARVAEFGVCVRSAGLRDIVLPGEMKTILNQVIEAERQAQANLIKRREETAAARSQANTAKLLAENPILARLKELEMLQDILRDTKATFVFGGGDIAEQVRGLVRKDAGT